MDGRSLTNGLAQLINETVSSSDFLDSRSSYDFLYEAACEFCRRTRVLTATQTITTVANQSGYDLNPDFLSFYLRNSQNQYVIKHNDGTSDNFVYFRDYEANLYSNQTTAVPYPSSYSIIDTPTLTTRITGTVTSAGVSSNGECTLTDSAAPFSAVCVGDDVHNTTDSSDGLVIGITSTSAIVTALFGGTDNDWDSSDAYVIVPQGRKQLILDSPPSVSGHTITLQYVQKPLPVYSPFATYRFDRQYEPALVKYAAWLYKYKDSEPNFGDAFFKYWDMQCRMANKTERKSFDNLSMRVNFNKRSYGDRSYR